MLPSIWIGYTNKHKLKECRVGGGDFVQFFKFSRKAVKLTAGFGFSPVRNKDSEIVSLYFPPFEADFGWTYELIPKFLTGYFCRIPRILFFPARTFNRGLRLPRFLHAVFNLSINRRRIDIAINRSNIEDMNQL